MSYNEILDLDTQLVVVPYHLVIPAARGLPELNAAMCSGRVSVVNGWACSNIRSLYKTLSTRELRKGSFAVYRINQSTRILEGGVIDTFVSAQINALLALALDFGMDQESIQVDGAVFQMNLWQD